jgi:hypothetical protein
MKSQLMTTEWGVEGEVEREREQWIKRMREGVLDRIGNATCQMWPLEKLNTWF